MKKTIQSVSIVAVLAAPAASATDDGIKRGRETGLPLPRFVSLKSKAVNLRVGPGRKYAIRWHYKKQGLPVEVIQEFEQWRRIRDSEGSTGWVLHSLLSSHRTALVAPWTAQPSDEEVKPTPALFDGKVSADGNASTVARVQSGLLVDVEECDDTWCEVEAQSTRLWLKRTDLWGVYPDEVIDN